MVLPYGVPQGSVLGPQLFTVYTSPLAKVITEMDSHFYADDSTLYVAFKPKSPASIATSLLTIQQCTTKISSWMANNFLKLNSDKTEVLVLTPPSLSSHSITTVQIADSSIKVSEIAKGLGVTLDSCLNLESHVKLMCKKAYHQIFLIRSIRAYITEDAARALMQANVTAIIDYCNSLLYGLPSHLIGRIQRVQNSAARVVKQLGKYCHITPVLKELHWLPVRQRIEYKITLLVFKGLNNQAPSYITDLLVPYQPARSLRSQDSNLLTTQQARLQTFGARSFSCVAPKLWNSLPSHMRHMTSGTEFKRALKTLKFCEAFGT